MMKLIKLCHNRSLLHSEHTRKLLEASPALVLAWKMPQLDPILPWDLSHDPKGSHLVIHCDPVSPADDTSQPEVTQASQWALLRPLWEYKSHWFLLVCPPSPTSQPVTQKLAYNSYISFTQPINIEPVALLSVFALGHELSIIINPVIVYFGHL